MSNPNTNILPTLETLTELLQSFRQEVITRLDKLEASNKNLTQGVEELRQQGEELRLQMMRLETRRDRLASQVHEMGAYVYSHNADLRVLTAEVRAWAKDVVALPGVTGGLRS